MADFPKVVPVYPGEPFIPPEPLSDYQIQMIHAGLLIPNKQAVYSMAREIRKWRGVKNPDLI
jgi:hypothetical protein